MAKEKINCSFCGRSEKDVEYIISSMGANVCDSCIDELYKMKQEDKKIKDKKYLQKLEVKKPREIKEYLDQYVIGQEEAKKVLSVAVYNHYKRLNYNFETLGNGKSQEVEIDKSNIIIVGQTGTGKTLLARTIARMLNVPFAIADATVLTEAGYVGEDVETILTRLLQAADYDVEKAERGIVFIDEIDKIARKTANPSITRDVSGEGVQQGLLKILEGTVAAVPPKGGRKHPEQSLVHIKTRNVLFICGGAFETLDKIIAQRVNQGGMGFGAHIKTDKENTLGELFKQLEPDDLIHFGLIPELVGRLPVAVALEELDEQALLNILTRPKNALVKQFKKLFELDGIELEFTEDALQEIVKEAMARKTGARGLRSVLEKALQQAMFELPGTKTKSLMVSAEMIRHGINSASEKKSVKKSSSSVSKKKVA